MSVDAKAAGEGGNRVEIFVSVGNAVVAATALDDAFAQALCFFGEVFGKAICVLLKTCPTAQNLNAGPGLVNANDVHCVGKTVEQLRAQVAFFRIHGSDEYKAGGMLDADAFALDDVDAHGRAIQ